jgi:molybdopterin-binding protein
VATAGPLIRLEVNCGFPVIGLVTRSSAHEMGFEIGRDVYSIFKATTTHAIRRLI